MIDLKELKEDRARLERLLQQTQTQLWRYEGALSYVMDNIKKLEGGGEENDRERTDRES